MDGVISVGSRKILDGLYRRKDLVPYKLLELENHEREILSDSAFHKQEGSVSDILIHDSKLRTDLGYIYRAHGNQVACRFLRACVRHYWKQQIHRVGIYLRFDSRTHEIEDLSEKGWNRNGSESDSLQHLIDGRDYPWSPDLGRVSSFPTTELKPSLHPITRLCESLAAYTNYAGFRVGVAWEGIVIERMSVEYATQVQLELQTVTKHLSNDMLSCGEKWLKFLEKDAQFVWFWTLERILKHAIRILKSPDLFFDKLVWEEWRITATKALPSLKRYYERLKKSPEMEAAYEKILTCREEERINGRFYQEAFRNHLETPMRISLDPGLLPKLDLQIRGSKMQYFPCAAWSVRWMWLERFATLKKALNEARKLEKLEPIDDKSFRGVRKDDALDCRGVPHERYKGAHPRRLTEQWRPSSIRQRPLLFLHQGPMLICQLEFLQLLAADYPERSFCRIPLVEIAILDVGPDHDIPAGFKAYEELGLFIPVPGHHYQDSLRKL